MAGNRGYDVVVDIDAEGDLGHTDLQEDLEFHNSNFDTAAQRGAGGTVKSAPAGGASSGIAPGIGGIGADGGAAGGKRTAFSLPFYAQYFDVDTAEVLRRCRAALWPRAPFLDVLDANPDLYGPFWIATSVVAILFLAGTVSWKIGGGGREGFDWGLLSGSAGLIYGYTGIVPIALYFTLKWFGSESANLLECWCLYGYANLIWIPVALISWSPITILNYVFVGLGLAQSSFFLVRNLYPVLSAADMRTSKMLLIIVVALHTGLAIAIKVLFFAHGSPVMNEKPEDHTR